MGVLPQSLWTSTHSGGFDYEGQGRVGHESPLWVIG
jgi:hypothetical protein